MTRANFIYRTENREDVIYYSYCDGYLSGVGADLINFAKKAAINNVPYQSLIPDFYDEVDRLSGNIEYLYTIDDTADTIVIKAYKFDMFDKRSNYVEYLLNETKPLDIYNITKNFKFDVISEDDYAQALESLKSKIYLIAETAKKVHDDVNQKYGNDNESYFIHLHSVATITQDYLKYILIDKEDILSVVFGAYFHDSIEDARLTYNDVLKIAKQFMSEEKSVLATEIAYALTNEKGRSRKERANDKYYADIRTTKYAPLVKVADRFANMKYSADHKETSEDSARMYKVYHKELEHFLYEITCDAPLESELTVPEKMKEDMLKI